MQSSQASQSPTTIASVNLDDLDAAPGDNPNVMSEERYHGLVGAIDRGDFYQPILVRPTPGKPGRYTVVDGMHRWKATGELGFNNLWAVVADLTELEAKAVRIGMNRLRGDLDLGVVARQVAEMKLAGMPIDDLTMTGFSTDEVDDLLRSATRGVDDVMHDTGVGLDDELDPGEPDIKPFVLELAFAAKVDLARAKRGLRKAAGGKGMDLATGLLRLLDGGE